MQVLQSVQAAPCTGLLIVPGIRLAAGKQAVETATPTKSWTAGREYDSKSWPYLRIVAART